MLRQANDQMSIREKIVADGVRPLAAELRMIDIADLVTYLHSLNFANVGDLISSAVELHFKPGTMWFGQAGDVKLEWYGRPVVTLNMELHNMDISVYFRLILDSFAAGVEIHYINFGEDSLDALENTRRLALAVEDARLAPVVQPAPRKAALSN